MTEFCIECQHCEGMLCMATPHPPDLVTGEVLYHCCKDVRLGSPCCPQFQRWVPTLSLGRRFLNWFVNYCQGV